MGGETIMSDEEFDTLKATLKEEKSQFAVSKEPKCYIDTGICTATWQVDQFRINPLLLFALGAFPITLITKGATEDYIFVRNKIAYGPCPSCSAEGRVYFGDVFSVPGFGDIASTKCVTCKAKYDVQRGSLRASTLPK